MTFQRLAVLTTALLLAACASALPPAAPDLRVSGNSLFITAEIDGKPIEALLDSVSAITFLDNAVAVRLGLDAVISPDQFTVGFGSEYIAYVEILETRAAGITFDHPVVAVVDLSYITNRVVREPVAAIFSSELLDVARFYLDIETGTFYTTPDTALEGAVRLPLTDARGIKRVPVSIEGHSEILAVFDLGNESHVLISEDFARRAGILDDARITGTESVGRFTPTKGAGGIGGPVIRQLVTLETLEIGGHTLLNVDAAIDPSPDAPDANVGVSVLRQFELLIDFPGGAVWLRPRAG